LQPVTIEALIISFNTEAELRVTLRSLLSHIPPDPVEFRVSVYDNASADGSPVMVENEFPSVRLVRGEMNLGFGKANNLLAESSDADYLLLLNSDVVLNEDVVSPLLEVLQTRPEVIVAAPRLLNVDGTTQHSAQQLPTLRYELARVLRAKRVGRALTPVFDSQSLINKVQEIDLTEAGVARDSEFVWATCWLVRRSDVVPGKLFAPDFPMYDEDLEFCRRAQEDGRKLAYVSEAKLTHIGGASTVSSDAKARLMWSARRRYYRVHHGAFASLTYAVLVSVVGLMARLIQRIPGPAARNTRIGS
jgi:N-acetylglucosaminyl-diphospho-decaprenol L-rhamnosyltransferase